MTESQEQDKQLEIYFGTLQRMASGHPRTAGLSPDDIRSFWQKIPTEQKNGILLLAQFQVFFDQIKGKRSEEDQEAVMNRDKNRKKDPNFARFVTNSHTWCNEMVTEGSLLGHWYISQSGKTQLERDLDGSGIDKVLEVPNRGFVLMQFGTRFGDARDKVRRLSQRYGRTNLIGVMPMRAPEELKRDLTGTEFKGLLQLVVNDTFAFSPNIMASAFPASR